MKSKRKFLHKKKRYNKTKKAGMFRSVPNKLRSVRNVFVNGPSHFNNYLNNPNNMRHPSALSQYEINEQEELRQEREETSQLYPNLNQHEIDVANKMGGKKSNRRHKRSSKNKKGGLFGFFESKHNSSNPACDVNNLSSLTTSQALHQNYQTCCPKGTFGTKNSSPYCKQVDTTFQSLLKAENNNLDPSNFSDVPKAKGSWFSGLFGSKKIQSPTVNSLASRTAQYENEKPQYEDENGFSPQDRNSTATTVDWSNPNDSDEEMQRYSTVTNNGQNYQGGRRKSRKHRKSRKSRKSRKH